MGLLSTLVFLLSCGEIFAVTSVAPTTAFPPVSPVRLVGGSGPYEGRVEVLKHGQWGTICDHYWSYNNAYVVCRQLGFSGDGDGAVAAYLYNAAFGEGTGPIWLSDLKCRRTETSLDECERYEHDHERYPCSHGDDVGVVCKQGQYQNSVIPSIALNPGESAVSGQIRLFGGTAPYAGVLQVFHRGVWGMVCDDCGYSTTSWRWDNGQVVCRQLGFGRIYYYSSFRNGQTDVVWLDDVFCTGDERSLDECVHRDWGYHNCNPKYEAIYIRCREHPDPTTKPVTPTSAPAPIRLVGGGSAYKGRVEIYLKGQWGTICDDWWSTYDASVACKQLGFQEGAAYAPRNAAFGQGSGPIWLTRMSCWSHYNSLDQCRSSNDTSSCDHSSDAGVVCKPDYHSEVIPTTTATAEPTTSASIRLVGTSVPYYGRVEILHQGIWGSVCNDYWDRRDGDIVCRQLGFGRAYFTSTLSGGSAPIWLDDVLCTGVESSLEECAHRDWGYHNCHKGYEEASVYCRPQPEPATTLSPIEWNATEPSILPVRLVGGYGPNEGRVEILHRGVWGSVCDEYWDARDGDVVCRQLGFGLAQWIIPLAGYGKGSGPIWLDGWDCDGDEASLNECSHNDFGDHSCSHSQDAGVYCWQGASLTNCEGSFMAMYVNRSLIKDGVASDLHLNDPRCKAVDFDKHFIQILATYDLCGTTVEQDESGATIYKNEVIYLPSSSTNQANIVSRDSSLHIPLTCRMEAGVSAPTASFHPNMRTMQFEEENFGTFGFQMLIFRNESYRTPYNVERDYPIQVHVKDRVYFEARANTRKKLQLFVDSCYATPSPNPSDTPNYVILNNGCPKDETFRLLPSTEPTVQRFSLEAFLFIGEASSVYIHCEMLICKPNDHKSRCEQGCRSRPLRNFKDDKSSRLYSLYQGPLVIQEESHNARNRRAAHKKLVVDEAQESHSSDMMITLLGTGLLISMCVIAVYIGFNSGGKRSVNRVGVWSQPEGTEYM